MQKIKKILSGEFSAISGTSSIDNSETNTNKKMKVRKFVNNNEGNSSKELIKK